MTLVKLTKNMSGKQTGDTTNVSPGAAAYLIASGHAQAIQDTPVKRGRPTKGKAGDGEDEGVGAPPNDSPGITAG